MSKNGSEVTAQSAAWHQSSSSVFAVRTANADNAIAAARSLSWLLAGVLFVLYAALSVRLHQRMLTTGFDLGIFEQAVRSYAEGRLPVSELKGPGFPLLGDHFSPILAVLAPFYRLWPSPITLLVAQAMLLAVAVVPLARWACETLGPRAALVTGLGYGTSWGIAQTVGFDFHEVCFGVPLLAFSLTALARDRLRAAAAWALPLVLVKEDLGLTVAVIGALIIWRGGRGVGLATVITGVAATLLEVLVLIPAFSPSGTFTYLDSIDGVSNTGTGMSHGLYQFTMGLITPDTKVQTLLMLLAPSAFLALRSPLLWAALPTLLWRFASDNPDYWGTRFHYSAILMPIVFAAFLHALTRKDQPAGVTRQNLLVSAAVTALLLPQFPLWQLVQASNWRSDPRLSTARALLDRIPNGATVAASNHLVPQLTNRTRVSVLGLPESRPHPQWIVADTVRPDGWPITPQQEQQLLADFLDHGYRTVAHPNGFVLLSADPAPR